jgi:predicted amidohydrolase YtcJ
VHALEGGAWLPDRDVDILLEQAAALPVRSLVYWQTTDVDAVVRRGLPRMGGDIWLDGAYGEHTAALSAPYADQPTTRGVLYYSDAALREMLGRAHRAGLQVAMHAIGDQAIDQALTAIGHVVSRAPKPDHRHRIEHFSLPRPAHLEQAAHIGVALSMQPPFASEAHRRGLAHLLGAERLGWRHPYRRLIDVGLLVAGGSDSDCAPLDPWRGMAELVEHPEPERRLSHYEALSLYTLGASRIGFEEDRKGSLEPGKLADLAILERDPLSASAAELRRMAITAVLVGGRVVHGALPSLETVEVS